MNKRIGRFAAFIAFIALFAAGATSAHADLNWGGGGKGSTHNIVVSR